MLIGLCGGSGSGKSTIIESIKEEFPGQVSVIDMDNYYISRADLPFEERRLLNYDVPESLDWDCMISHIKSLSAGETIYQPFRLMKDWMRRRRRNQRGFLLWMGFFLSIMRK